MEITVKNFRGCAEAHLTLEPVALVCGANGAGKSSIAQAVAAAVTRNPAPLTGMKKSDAGQLLREGEKRGRCTIEGGRGSVTANWPGGKITDEAGPKASEIAAGLTSIVDMKPKDAAAFLIQLMGALPNRDDLAAALPGIDPDMLAAIWARIEAEGWDGAHKRAVERGQQYKGMWEQITGEKWGAKKGEDWRPPGLAEGEVSEDAVAELRRQLEEAIAANAAEDAAMRELQAKADRVPELEQRLDDLPDDDLDDLRARLEHAIANRAGDAGERERLQEQVGRLDQLRADRAEAEAALAKASKALEDIEAELRTAPRPVDVKDPVRCPHCDGAIEVISRTEVRVLTQDVDEDANRGRAETIAKLTESHAAANQQFEEAQQQFYSLRAEVARAELAAERLASLPSGTVTEDEIAALRQRVRDAETAHALARELDEARAAAEALASRPAVPTQEDIQALRDEIIETELAAADARRYRQAAETHAKILDNQKLIDELAPTGLRQRKLEARLAELNAELADVCGDAGWPIVYLSDDLSVIVGGRPYALLSESEKFRARVALQVVIAKRDGSDVVVIDAADILDRNGRNGLFTMLPQIDLPALVCMTMNGRDDVPDLARVGMGRSYWIGDAVLAPVGA